MWFLIFGFAGFAGDCSPAASYPFGYVPDGDPWGSKHVGVFTVILYYKYLRNSTVHFFLGLGVVNWRIMLLNTAWVRASSLRGCQNTSRLCTNAVREFHVTDLMDWRLQGHLLWERVCSQCLHCTVFSDDVVSAPVFRTGRRCSHFVCSKMHKEALLLAALPPCLPCSSHLGLFPPAVTPIVRSCGHLHSCNI
jgi:hypothetical protein